MNRRWLVFYTKARWEKKVNSFLQKFGFESYLPVQKVLRQWSDRKKKVEAPLFSSYIFVRENESRIPEILKVPGISWNIRHNGKPAILRDSELKIIQRFIDTGLTIETQSVENLEIGNKVKVMDGPLKGVEGFLTGKYNSQVFTVILETIDQAIKLNLDKHLLKKIDE